ELAARYTAALQNHPWLLPPHVPAGAEPNFQSYAVRLQPDAPLSRDELMQRLLEDGIATRRGIMLAHFEAACADLPPAALPRSEDASRQSFLLPLYPQMTDAEQDRVIAALEDIARGCRHAHAA